MSSWKWVNKSKCRLFFLLPVFSLTSLASSKGMNAASSLSSPLLPFLEGSFFIFCLPSPSPCLSHTLPPLPLSPSFTCMSRSPASENTASSITQSNSEICPSIQYSNQEKVVSIESRCWEHTFALLSIWVVNKLIVSYLTQCSIDAYDAPITRLSLLDMTWSFIPSPTDRITSQVSACWIIDSSFSLFNLSNDLNWMTFEVLAN